MGNSGGGYTPRSRSGTELNAEFEKRDSAARRKITENGARRRNVFISFDVDEDKPQVRLLASQARDDRFPFEFRDYSVKERIEKKWKERVSEKISRTSAVIVAVGEKTHESMAVEWEIREAHRQGKKVIGVRLYKDKDHRVPSAMTEHGDTVVVWNARQIAQELEQEQAA